ncbi:MAG TPA: indolepyruvate ferredoxin oxidoreductase family protein [Sphingobium sp.]|nr:indolepyruvate ferredoxin oxidoreductase family protein [Sphingobium sp.]
MATDTYVIDKSISLDDKWQADSGRVIMNGTQAIGRVLLARKAIDTKRGLRTAGYISGYRGSPLGNVDTMLWGLGKRLAAAEVTFVPGVNEDMAATAVRGTQQIESVPNPLYDGVFGAWYGKGPGVDRAGDALKHGNYIGAHRNGGVVAFYGDDHGGKSSSLSHHSEQAMASYLIPSFYPADPGEVLSYGLLAYELSRYSGLWVGVKLVNEIAEQTLTVDLNLDDFAPVIPGYGELPPEGIHVRGGALTPMRDEEIVSDYRLPLVPGFIRANGLDRTIFRAEKPRIGLITAGKSYKDTLQALTLLGLDEKKAAALGISLYKVGCIWPLEQEGIAAFAEGHELLFFIEEKKSFVELQAAAALVNLAVRPRLIGKLDEEGKRLLPPATQLEPILVAHAIAGRLRKLGITEGWTDPASADNAAPAGSLAEAGSTTRRSPWFCSGCPHSRSTKVPQGSVAMAGIGCHVMTNFLIPERTLAPTHMGGEGGNWMGMAPFTGTKHVFQNMGDGTYYHSGLMAIRAAIASGVNITYKILYNDAVAMTGGQPVDGPLSVAEIAQQVRHEGAKQVIVVSDDPSRHQGTDLPAGTRIEHRDQLDAVQKELREVPGCTVMIYEQTCAAEKRRRRKRGTFPDPAKRLFISEAVCEGCGDCSVQSTCVSLTPVDTDFGTKRKIDQSSCNKDYSCLNGFCPSFVTVYDAQPRKQAKVEIADSLFVGLTEPQRASLGEEGLAMMVAGIGGTGVITVAQVLAMAAHLEGTAASVFDMTGLAQKNGAVMSHVRFASSPDAIHAPKLGKGDADLLLAFDLVTALGDDSKKTLAAGRTRALVNSDVTPTVALQFNRDARVDVKLLLTQLRAKIGKEQVETVDATGLATALMGDSIATNFFVVGLAVQRGLLPIGTAAIERAIELNGTAIRFNLDAFRLGRLFAIEPDRVLSLLPKKVDNRAKTLDELFERQIQHLTDYQGPALAERYGAAVGRIKALDARIGGADDRLVRAVVTNYGRVLAYKDEYEVARLLTSPAFEDSLRNAFEDGGRIEYNFAPPILGGKPVNGRPPKRAFNARLMRPALSLMARMKGLRGTRLDLFGYTEERKKERALIAHYEGLIDLVAADLKAHNREAAVKLLEAVSAVRGYGPVKDEALEKYHGAIGALEQGFRSAEVQAVAA